MNNLSAFPFVRLAFCFALGIVTYHYLGDYLSISAWLIGFLFAVYIFLALKSSLRFQYLLSSISLVLLFSIGAKRLEFHKNLDSPSHLINQEDKIEAYRARVAEEPEKKEKSTQLKLEIYEVLSNEGWREANGLINAYADPMAYESIRIGDLLVVRGFPSVLEGPANPGEFNYKNYLVYNRIYHQHFIRGDYQLIGHKSPNWLLRKALQLRSFAVDKVSISIQDQEARAVVMALVLGVKEELEDDLILAFSATGAMHVLAVSGLHVGIIYGLIFMVFRGLGLNKKKYRWLMALLSIAILWFYAMLTGLSPSVLRAVTMFSAVALGQALQRKGNIYNTLALSALALLLYNPYLIMSVGFQLSYLAVFGIVFIQPRIYRLIDVRNPILDKAWAITCVSIAAQLATGPLSVLYFHKFPSYFLLSNLFIIPAAFVILLMGLLMILTSFIPPIGDSIGWLLGKFVGFVNDLVFKTSELPGSVIEGLYLNILDTWLIYAVFGAVILLFVTKKFRFLYAGLVASLFFCISQINHFHSFSKTYEFDVLKASSSSVLDIRHGFQSKAMMDSTFKSDTDRQQFHLIPKRLLSGSSQKPSEDRLSIQSRDFSFGRLVVHEGKSVLLLDRSIPKTFRPAAPIRVDLIVFSEEFYASMSELPEKFEAPTHISDTSISAYRDRNMNEEASKLGMNYHSVRQDGYFAQVWRK